MNKNSAVDQSAFDSLLTWLDPDREKAGSKYEFIRLRLIKLFACRGCTDAEELADETINRVTVKASRLMADYVGDPALYFYGVAHKVHLEAVRKRPVVPIDPPAEKSLDDELEYECLDRCMEKLTTKNRDLVLEYYQFEKRLKIDHRKMLADRLGIGQNALRIRAHRVRLTLYQCVTECLTQSAPA
jgi:DNA-directed RNA polymerase specialized sigma24 family protein